MGYNRFSWDLSCLLCLHILQHFLSPSPSPSLFTPYSTFSLIWLFCCHLPPPHGKFIILGFCSVICCILIASNSVQAALEVWTPGPNSWDSTYQVRPFACLCQLKKHSEGQKKEIYYRAQDAGRRVSTQLIFSHLQGANLSYRFK
jgi:hypothetical protein